jgi:hypothetical protein
VNATLVDWLAPLDLATFLGTHRSKQPYARPGSAAGAVSLFQWATLQQVLGSRQPLDLMVVRGGVLFDVAPPRSLRDVRGLLDHGLSVVIRGGERHLPELAALAASFVAAVGGEVHVQLYVTPSGTNSFGWHYDFEDVFVAQTLGAKDYYFRDNTVARHTGPGDQLDFSSFRQETSPILSARLLPGDWLYIPARWWHLVQCLEESLSISIGVLPAALPGSW